MKRVSVVPESKEQWLEMREDYLTSTDVAALFNRNPYMTKWELWHRKAKLVSSDFRDSERMAWGRRLEMAIAAGVAEERGWVVAPMDEFITLPEVRLGSSFDFRIKEPRAILEIKNVDGLVFHRDWEDSEKEVAPPAHIEFQIQHQMLVAGDTKAYIGALIGGNRLVVLERDADPVVHEAILAEAEKFWESIADNDPPPLSPDTDIAAIQAVYSHAEPGKIIEAPPEIEPLIDQYRHATDLEKAARKDKDVAKGQILAAIGDAEKVLGEGWTVSAGLVPPTQIEAYERKGYRTFRVAFKRQKEVAQ